MVYTFDEMELRTKLLTLDKRSIAIFSASCATRLFREYEIYKKAIGQDALDEDVVSKGLSAFWEVIKPENEFRGVEAILEHLELSVLEEDEAHNAGVPYAADASAAVYFAVSTYHSDPIQNAVWTARRVYEALDSYIIDEFNIDPSTLEGETKVINHPLMQKELFRQNRDIQELVLIRGTTDSEVVERFYQRARDEARDVFE